MDVEFLIICNFKQVLLYFNLIFILNKCGLEFFTPFVYLRSALRWVDLPAAPEFNPEKLELLVTCILKLTIFQLVGPLVITSILKTDAD